MVGIGGVVVTRGGLQILASLLGDHDRRFPNVSHSLWWLINIFFKKFWCFCISNQYIQIQYFIKCFEGNKSQKRTRDQTDTCTSSSSRLCFLHQYSLFSLCQRTVTQDFISYLFFFLIAVPDALKFLQSIGQFLFGNRERPTCVRFVMVCVFNADVLLYIVLLWGSHYWFTKSCV